MAVKSQTKTRIAVSSAVEDLSTGRADDFDGEIVGGCFQPIRTKKGDTMLTARIDYVPSPDSGFEPFSERYFVGFEAEKHFGLSSEGYENDIDLNDFDPTDPHSCEAAFLVPLDPNNPKRLSKSSMLGFFLSNLHELGFDEPILNDDGGYGNLAGIYGHFNRQEPVKRAGKAAVEGEEKKPERDNRVLIPTELKPKPKGAGGAKSAAGKPAAKGGKPNDSATREALSEFIKEILGSAKNNSLQKGKIASAVIKSYDGDDKKAAMALSGDDEFLGSIDGTTFDGDSGVLTLD